MRPDIFAIIASATIPAKKTGDQKGETVRDKWVGCNAEARRCGADAAGLTKPQWQQQPSTGKKTCATYVSNICRHSAKEAGCAHFELLIEIDGAGSPPDEEIAPPARAAAAVACMVCDWNSVCCATNKFPSPTSTLIARALGAI